MFSGTNNERGQGVRGHGGRLFYLCSCLGKGSYFLPYRLHASTLTHFAKGVSAEVACNTSQLKP